MRISSSDYSALIALTKKHTMKDVPASMRLKIVRLDPKKGNADLQSLGAEDLAKLMDLLPHGGTSKLTSPRLTRLRDKVKRSLAGLRMRHLDPEAWPQVWRMQMRLNTARAGLKAGSLGQVYKLNPKGMSLDVPLRGTIRWTNTDAGDLNIIGPWSDISAMLGSSSARFKSAFGDILRGDVNVEFDRMYGPPKGDVDNWDKALGDMPLVVSVTKGRMLEKSDDEGTVVADPAKEIVQMAAGKLAGIVAPTEFKDATLHAVNGVKMAIESINDKPRMLGEAAVGLAKTRREEKTYTTVTIGVGPVGRNYAVGSEEMTAAEVLEMARRLT